MINIRNLDGTSTPVPEGHFVEICAADGAVARIFHEDQNGIIRVMNPKDIDAQRYAKLFGVKLTQVVVLPPEKGL